MLEVSELSEAIDAFNSMRAFRLSEQKRIDELKSQEAAMRQGIRETLEANKLRGASGATHTFSLYDKEEPNVEDWETLEAHVKATGQFDLLQRRISSEAVRQRWDRGEEVPGVGKFTNTKVSLVRNK